MKREEELLGQQGGSRANGTKADGFRYVVGTDEAGRGPLAGPVVAAAAIICPR